MQFGECEPDRVKLKNTQQMLTLVFFVFNVSIHVLFGDWGQ